MWIFYCVLPLFRIFCWPFFYDIFYNFAHGDMVIWGMKVLRAVGSVFYVQLPLSNNTDKHPSIKAERYWETPFERVWKNRMESLIKVVTHLTLVFRLPRYSSPCRRWRLNYICKLFSELFFFFFQGVLTALGDTKPPVVLEIGRASCRERA